MKNSTIVAFGMSLLAALPMGAETPSPFSVLKGAFVARKNVSAKQKMSQEKSEPKEFLKISEMASKFKPTVIKTYGWTGKKWIQDESITYTYDTKGNTLTETSVNGDREYVNTVYEYDTNDKVIFKESKVSGNGVDFENYRKTQFEYDPILTNVITTRTEWLWMNVGKGYDWQLVGNNYKRTFVRNDDGNVTNVVIAVLFQDIYDPTQRLNITYGEDGKAVSMSESILGYDGREYYWQDGIKLSDIEWENTDGQFYDIDMLFTGNNRIKSAIYEEPGSASARVNAEYGADGSYTVHMIGEIDDEPLEQTMRYTPYENDGYRLEVEATIMDVKQYEVTEEQYDEWGHMILSYNEWSADDEPKVVEQVIGEVVLDKEGFPTSYTVIEESYDINTGETDREYAFRAEYFDYKDSTASVGYLNENPEAPTRYYNLQGVQIENPAKGDVVIKCQGEKTFKIKY